MARSPELQEYLAELSQIDGLSISDGEVETAKLHMIREKEKRHAKLREKWNTPEPPWHVSADVIWNIHNTPAAQISILGGITGLAFAPVAACSTFGVALGLAARAIQSGEAKTGRRGRDRRRRRIRLPWVLFTVPACSRRAGLCRSR